MGWYIERHGIASTKRKIGYMMQGSLAERLRILRAREGMTLTEASERIGITRHTLSSLERGGQEPHYPTLAKIARGYGVPVEDLLEESVPLAEAPSGAGRIEWDTAVRGARQLRERGWRRMEEALSAWRASKERGEAPDARREYREEMGALLQQAYDAETALLEALADPLDLDEFAEVQTADWVYWRLRAMVTEGTGLSIREEAEHGASQDARPVRVDTSLRPGYPMEVF
jgi:XRE family transcriptional regulator of biofilm formation